jgi:hypothetical protein
MRVEIVRIDEKLVVVPLEAPGKLDNVPERHDVIAGDPEDFVHMDWSLWWKCLSVQTRDMSRTGVRVNLPI